ncbi:MAG: metallophosphoesterase family protein [Christensenellales bacterium]
MTETKTIGVVSDTHGNRRAFEWALGAIKEMVIAACGRFCKRRCCDGRNLRNPVETVAGNCDFFGSGQDIS